MRRNCVVPRIKMNLSAPNAEEVPYVEIHKPTEVVVDRRLAGNQNLVFIEKTRFGLDANRVEGAVFVLLWTGLFARVYVNTELRLEGGRVEDGRYSAPKRHASRPIGEIEFKDVVMFSRSVG